MLKFTIQLHCFLLSTIHPLLQLHIVYLDCKPFQVGSLSAFMSIRVLGRLRYIKDNIAAPNHHSKWGSEVRCLCKKSALWAVNELSKTSAYVIQMVNTVLKQQIAKIKEGKWQQFPDSSHDSFF